VDACPALPPWSAGSTAGRECGAAQQLPSDAITYSTLRWGYGRGRNSALPVR